MEQRVYSHTGVLEATRMKIETCNYRYDHVGGVPFALLGFA